MLQYYGFGTRWNISSTYMAVLWKGNNTPRETAVNLRKLAANCVTAENINQQACLYQDDCFQTVRRGFVVSECHAVGQHNRFQFLSDTGILLVRLLPDGLWPLTASLKQGYSVLHEGFCCYSTARKFNDTEPAKYKTGTLFLHFWFGRTHTFESSRSTLYRARFTAE